MNWYYANAGQQSGPVNDEEFDRLIAAGTIQPSTLVWGEGMANWEPLSKVRPAATATAAPLPLAGAGAPGPGQVVCSECRRTMALEETMQMNNRIICAACKPLYVQKLREGAPSATGLAPGEFRYAGFWIRFVAKFIDNIIVSIPTVILYVAGMFVFGVSTTNMGAGGQPPVAAMLASLGLQLGAQFVGLVIGALYTVFFLVKYGATPGKMAVGLRVVTADGGDITVGRAIGRFFAEIVSGLTCYIGYIIAGFDDQKRSLHDHMCSTRVIYK